ILDQQNRGGRKLGFGHLLRVPLRYKSATTGPRTASFLPWSGSRSDAPVPDLKLTSVLEAADPERLRPALEPFFGPDAEPALEMTRLQPPLCFWAVYRHGDKWAVFKSFFSEEEYEGYVDQLEQHYPDRLGQPDHPK